MLVYGWRPRKLVTLAVFGEGKQVAGDRVGGRILTVFSLCLFNFRMNVLPTEKRHTESFKISVYICVFF